MQKFCGKCGTKLDENGVCILCEKTISADASTKTDDQPIALANQNDSIIVETESGTPTKKNNKSKIVIILLCVIIVALVVSLILLYISTKKSTDANVTSNSKPNITSTKTLPTNNCVTLENDNHLYYSPDGKLYNITDRDNIEQMYVNHECIPFYSQSVYYEDTIYSRDIDSIELYKYTLNSNGKFEKKLWVDVDDFKDAGMYECSAPAFRDPVVCGNYVYFSYRQTIEHYTNDVDIEKGYGYNLCRISFDGDVELFEDIHAATLTTDGKYIYFLDNGYVRNTYPREADRIGLYKMEGNADPDKTELITNDLDIDLKVYEGIPDHAMFEKMMFVDDTIYYLETNSSCQNRLYRIGTDGKNKELVTNDPVAFYDIDEKSETLYYANGPSISTEPFSIYSLSLNSNDKEFLFQIQSSITSIELVGKYLYVQSINNKGIPGENKNANVMGFRYNINDDIMDIMYGYYEGAMEMVADPETGMYELQDNRGEPKFYFEKEEIDEDKVYNFTH